MLLRFLVLLAAVTLGALLLVLPLQMAAGAMGARRRGVVSCLLALVAAGVAQAVGLSVPGYGTLAAFLLASAVFAAVLGTSFLRGIGVAVLHLVFSAGLLFLLLALAGLATLVLP